MSKDKNSSSNQFFFFLISALLLAAAIHRYGPYVIWFLRYHKYCVAGFVSVSVTSLWVIVRNRIVGAWDAREKKRALLKPQDAESLFIGRNKNGGSIYIPLSARKMHAQVIGTTNAGKTESVIIPWAISDIEMGRGLVLIDGKSDRSLLNKLYSYAVKNHRAKDFRLLSLVNVEASSTFNPLIGGSPEEITERVFSSFTFEDEYYRNQQYDVLKHILILFSLLKIPPTFQRLIQVITDRDLLLELSQKVKDPFMKQWIERFVGLSKDERERRTSGLVTQLGHFATGETAKLFNSESPTIDFEQVLREGLIVYCQLPVMKTPVLGKATGKMVLQAIQSAVSTRHLIENKDFKFFGAYLDDFTEYLTPGFVSLLNKSRSGNIGVTFAHQALGDLAGLGEDVRNTILTNSNLKVFMRTNEPETAEYFSKSLGTRQNVKLTERQRRGLIGPERTGEASAREVEEFVHHPNLFKKNLGTGEAVVIVPLKDGSHASEVKFEMLADLPASRLPQIEKHVSPLLEKTESEEKSADSTESQDKVDKVIGGAA